jgi:PAS domain S-box-containing protein
VTTREVVYDVTRQVLLDEELRRTKEYLDNLITYANTPILVWDPQFRITLFNQAFEELTGMNENDILGKPVDVLIPGPYIIQVRNLIEKTFEGKRWENVEIPILDKLGQIRTILWNSAAIFGKDGKEIVSTIVHGQDITERKRIEAQYKRRAVEYERLNLQLKEEIKQRNSTDIALKNTLSLLNAALEATADGILVVDQDEKITSYNQNFIQMLDIPRFLMETDKVERIMDHIQPYLKDPKGFSVKITDLNISPASESFDMIEFKDGRIFERYSKPQKIGDIIVGRVWSFRDITDRKNAELKLLSSIEEKEVLLREIHHRVKNNLQLISGLLDMTRMRTADESTHNILTDMMLKIKTMAQIHTRLYESKQFGRINITEQIKDQISSLSNIYSYKWHDIACEIRSPEVFLPVDLALPCALVVNEILSNAFKHAFKGLAYGNIKITIHLKKGQVSLTVEDDGIGMPSDFDISRSGSLGLKLIRTLVQHQLKGSISQYSRNGTEISIKFPVNSTGL